MITAEVVVPHRLLRRLAAGRVDDGLAAKAGVWQQRSTLRRTVREPDRRHPPPRHFVPPHSRPSRWQPRRRRQGGLPAHAELDGQQLWLARHLVDGEEVLVATSDTAFSMPSDARPLLAEPGSPSPARPGDIVVACLSQPIHMLVVGHPGERLVQIGHQLSRG